MAIIQQKGLKGIRIADLVDYEDLSTDEQNDFLSKNPVLKDKSFAIKKQAYKNKNFINRYGLDYFRAVSDPKERDAIILKDATQEFVDNNYYDSPYYDLITQLEPESKLQLFQNYRTDEEFAEELKRLTLSDKDKEFLNSPMGKIATGSMASGPAAQMHVMQGQKPIDVEKNLEAARNQKLADREKIFTGILADDTRRKVSSEEAQTEKNAVLSNMYDRINEGDKTVDATVEEILSGTPETKKEPTQADLTRLSNTAVEALNKEIAPTYQGSGSYREFKDSSNFKNLTQEQKREWAAKYLAIRNLYGEQMANAALETLVHDYVVDGSTYIENRGLVALGILTTSAATLMEEPAGYAALCLAGIDGITGGDVLNNYLLGKDKDGNDLPKLFNPTYWQGVRDFNTFSPAAINRARENGVSKYNVQYLETGEDGNMSFRQKLDESEKMAGQMLGQMAAAYLVHKVGAGAQRLSGGRFRNAKGQYTNWWKPGAALDMKHASALTKSLFYTTTAAEITGGPAAIGFSYAKGNFDNLHQAGLLRADERAKEITGKSVQEIMDTQEIQQRIHAYAETQMLENAPTLEELFGENIPDKEVAEAYAAKIRKSLYEQYYEDGYQRIALEYSNLLYPDINDSEEIQGIRDAYDNAAIASFCTTATIEGLKYSATAIPFRSYLFDRGTIRALKGNPFGDLIRKGQKVSKTDLAKTFAWEGGKTITIGGLSNYDDEWVSAGSEAMGNNLADSYVKLLYDPGAKQYTTNIILDAMKAGLAEAGNVAFSQRALDAGIIGSLGTVVGGFISPAFIGKGFKKGQDESWVNYIGRYFQHPLLETYARLKEEADAANTIIDDVTKQLYRAGVSLDRTSESIASFGAFERAKVSGDVFSAKNTKMLAAFAFAKMMSDLGQNDLYAENRTVKESQELLEAVANGTLSEEAKLALVNRMLNQPENASLREETDSEQKAAEILQKNAKTLLKVQEEYTKAIGLINNSSKYKNISKDTLAHIAFLRVASKEWEDRIAEISKTLEISASPSEETSSPYLYGSEKGLIAARNVSQKQIESLTKKTESNNKRIAELKRRLSKPIGEEYRVLTEEQIHYLEVANKGIEEQISTIKENLEATSTFTEEIFKELPILLAQDIINASNKVRATMLNPLNKSQYNKAQQREIDKANKILLRKHPDAVVMVQDMATLEEGIRDSDRAYDLLLENPNFAEIYVSSLKNRSRAQALQQHSELMMQNVYEQLLNSAKKSMPAFLDLAREESAELLKDFVKQNPQFEQALSSTIERNETIEGIENTISNLEVSEAQKNALINSLRTIIKDANTSQEIIDAIENFIETTGDGKEETLVLREQMNEILNAAKDFNIVRDAAKAYSNQTKLEKDRKIRAAKDRKNAKAREQRAAKAEAERQARIAAEEARKAKEAEEERLRQEAEAKAKGEAMKGSKMEDTTKPGEVTVSNEETIDLGIEYDKNTSEVQTPVEEPTETPIETETPAEPNNELPPTDSNSEATQLRGNTLTPYSTKDLEEGKLTSREETVTDWLKDFFDWMKNAGIKFQDIIDFELGEIAKLNPTVHYMMAVTDKNATNDAVLSKTPLLVVEATDTIKKIHDESRGGIIKANGKEWLVIGMMGYAPNSNEQTAWQNTLDVLSANRDAYFKSNPTERFEVDSRLTTSIKEISNGRLIKQLPKDSEYQYRSISELLADAERNPYGLTWKDLSFAIQMATGGFELSRTLDGTVYTPSRTEENAGNVFIMVKATNGNYFPVAIRPTFLSEIRPGALQDMIDSLLQDVLNPDHKVRLTAVSRLKFLLNLNDEDNILVGKEGLNVVSIKQNGVVVDKFDLNAENFDRAQAFKKLKASRFRIQISKNNLQDIERLKQLDEAGALTTDAAMLATAGAGYTIYATDLETGKPIDYEPISSSENTTVRGSGLYRSQEPTQMLDGKMVTFHNGQWVDDSGKAITDAETLNKIKALNYIEEHKIPVAYKSKNGYNVYIVSESQDNPVVVMVNGSHNVNIYKGTDAQRAVDFHNQQQRDKAAKNANMEEIELNLTEKPKEVTTSVPSTPTVVSEKVTTSKEKTKEKETFSEVDGKKSVKDLQDSKNLLTFANIITNKSFGKQVRDALKQIFKDKGWGEMPKKISEIESFLNSKGVPMPSEMSQTQIDKWLDLIKNCIK